MSACGRCMCRTARRVSTRALYSSAICSRCASTPPLSIRLGSSPLRSALLGSPLLHCSTPHCSPRRSRSRSRSRSRCRSVPRVHSLSSLLVALVRALIARGARLLLVHNLAFVVECARVMRLITRESERHSAHCHCHCHCHCSS